MTKTFFCFLILYKILQNFTKNVKCCIIFCNILRNFVIFCTKFYKTLQTFVFFLVKCCTFFYNFSQKIVKCCKKTIFKTFFENVSIGNRPQVLPLGLEPGRGTRTPTTTVVVLGVALLPRAVGLEPLLRTLLY